MIGATAPARLLLIVAGFLIWGSSFVLLYGVNAVGCELGWPRLGLGPLSLQRGVLIVIWIVHLGGLGLLFAAVWQRLRSQDEGSRLVCFLSVTAVATAASALFATIWTGIPLIGLSTCT